MRAQPTRPIALLLLGLALVVVPWPEEGARASQRLPGEIRSSLGLGYTPQCSLCHFKGNTGLATVTTPFGLSARARGLTSGGGGRTGTNTALSAVLQQMADAGVDSDGDGVGDIAELIAGTDPNVYGAVPIPTNDPSYGCGSTGGAAALLPLLLLAGALARGRVLRRRAITPDTR